MGYCGILCSSQDYYLTNKGYLLCWCKQKDNLATVSAYKLDNLKHKLNMFHNCRTNKRKDMLYFSSFISVLSYMVAWCLDIKQVQCRW